MDGKLIYILLLIGYFVFKFFSEDKKAKERKKKLEDAKNPSLPKNETYEPAPKKEKPWDEILREIMDQSKQKRREVETVGPPPVRYPKFEPLKKVTQKKSSSKPQRKNIATSVQTSNNSNSTNTTNQIPYSPSPQIPNPSTTTTRTSR